MMDNLQPQLYFFGIALALAALGAFWRRKGGSAWLPAPRKRRIERLDRVALTHQHSVHLVSIEGRWLALAATPKGIELLESGPLPGDEAERGGSGDGALRVERTRAAVSAPGLRGCRRPPAAPTSAAARDPRRRRPVPLAEGLPS